ARHASAEGEPVGPRVAREGERCHGDLPNARVVVAVCSGWFGAPARVHPAAALLPEREAHPGGLIEHEGEGGPNGSSLELVRRAGMLATQVECDWLTLVGVAPGAARRVGQEGCS